MLSKKLKIKKVDGDYENNSNKVFNEIMIMLKN